MRIAKRVGRAAAVVLTALSLVVVSAAAANATPAGPDKRNGPAVDATASWCPSPGQRVQLTGSNRVYLIDPQGWWDWIPTETDYFNLFDSWNGIVVTGDSSCFSDGGALTGVKLVKLPSFPEVYIWDATVGLYRWIPSESAFNKYAFSWSKIRTQNPIGPIGGSSWNWN